MNEWMNEWMIIPDIMRNITSGIRNISVNDAILQIKFIYQKLFFYKKLIKFLFYKGKIVYFSHRKSFDFKFGFTGRHFFLCTFIK